MSTVESHSPSDPAHDDAFAIIDAARREVERVAADGDSRVTLASPAAQTDAYAKAVHTPIACDSFTGYEILREIHRGGQGVVYQALQKSTRRKVAIKVMKEGPFAGPGDRARFDREVQILGALKHPNIVAIHDTGMAAGCFYFVMDYISGQPLDVFMASTQRGIDETLKLFMKICEAVQVAHLRGVIHRDLKPSNIRVDQNGEPHILDFGLAKTVSGDSDAAGQVMTMTGQFVGSLPWASPEQAEGASYKIDLRTDVYGLGVVLYQMLTSKFPYEITGPMREVMDRIIRSEPVRPRTIRRQVDDEVETIVLKCLSKDRDRRYQTAGELGRDIKRYLSGEPIEAKRDSFGYMLRKQMRQYKLPAGIAAGFMLTVTAGFITSYAQWRKAEQEMARAQAAQASEAKQRDRAQDEAARAEREAQSARQERDKAERIAEFMADMLEGVKPSVALGRDTTMLREMLDAAAKRIENGELTAAPEAELRLRWTIGGAYMDIAADGALQRAETILLPTLKLAERSVGSESEQMADSLCRVADCLESLGRAAEALPKCQTALEIRQTLYQGDHPDVATSLNDVAECLESLGRFAEALASFEAALQMRQRLYPGDHPVVAWNLDNTANCLSSLGRSDEALPRFEAALQMRQRLFQGDHPDVAASLHNLAVCLQALGRPAEALPKYEAAHEINRRVFPGDHPESSISLSSLATCLQAMGRPAEALPKFEAALEMRQRLYRGDHPWLAGSLEDTANCLRLLGRPAEALSKLEVAHAMRQRLHEHEGDHPVFAGDLNNRALCLQALGRSAEALPMFEAAHEMNQRLYPGDHRETFATLSNLADCLQSLGRLAEALPKYEAADEMCQRLFGGDHPDVAMSLRNVAKCLYWLGRPAEALPRHEAALEMHRRPYQGDHPEVAGSLNGVANCLVALGRPAEALPKLEAGLEMFQRLFQGDHPDVATAWDNLACCLCSLGRFTDALPKCEAALEMRQKLFKGNHPDVARSLNSVAMCLQALGRFADALPKFEAALEMHQRLFQGDHPEAAAGLNAVASCLKSLGRSAEALPRFQAALAMRQRLFQGDHLDVVVSMHNVADCLHSLGRPAEALPGYREALDMCRRMYDQPHPIAAMILHHLADALYQEGDLPQAERFAKEAVQMYRAHETWHPNEHRHAEQVLADIWLAMSRPAETAAGLRDLVTLHRARLRETDPVRATSLAALAKVLLKGAEAESTAEAESLLRECLAIREKTFGPDHTDVWLKYEAMNLLGAALARQGKLTEAEPLLLDGYHGMKDDPRVPPPTRTADRKREALSRIVQLYEAWDAGEPGLGYDEKAAEWRSRLIAQASGSGKGSSP